uniref:Putative secreted protein n=1 Tax=Anopheles triannulatus TaxID=58253 RepID=A0A2M4AW39_9DIPT
MLMLLVRMLLSLLAFVGLLAGGMINSFPQETTGLSSPTERRLQCPRTMLVDPLSEDDAAMIVLVRPLPLRELRFKIMSLIPWERSVVTLTLLRTFSPLAVRLRIGKDSVGLATDEEGVGGVVLVLADPVTVVIMSNVFALFLVPVTLAGSDGGGASVDVEHALGAEELATSNWNVGIG